MLAGSRKLVLVALFTALLIVLVNLAWWFYYQKTERILDAQLSRRLAAVAQAAVVGIPSGKIEQLAIGDIDSYLEIVAILEQVRRADSLSEVFILDDNYRYLVTTLLEPDSVYFLTGLNAAYIDSLFFYAAAGVTLTPTYQTGRLYLKSAFAPLIGSQGFVVAVLGVEANVDYFDALTELRQNLYYATGLSLMGGILLGLLFLLLQRRISSGEQRLFLAATHAHLGRMVAVVTHELKNPLAIIRASAERLAKKSGMDEARYVVEEVDRLNGIVAGYLDFASSGGSLLAGDPLQTFRLDELIQNVKNRLNERFADEKLTWLSEQPVPKLTMAGHPRSLRQVLLNLLLNGVEACQQADRPAEIGVRISQSGAKLVITVADHGPGLSRKQLREAFTPFFTTKQSGSGLGLYLSRKIVIQMGGKTQISSRPDIGTEVVITLPLKPKD